MKALLPLDNTRNPSKLLPIRQFWPKGRSRGMALLGIKRVMPSVPPPWHSGAEAVNAVGAVSGGCEGFRSQLEVRVR
jgi:hypothetical protein